MDKLDLWVDFSLSFTSVISEFIQGNFQRKNIWLIFLDYFIQRYLDYFIIIMLFFGFNRDYCMNDRLGFILIVIKQYYNTNDRLKFILLFIKWENGLNKWLKHIKRGYEKQTKWK